MFVDTILNTLSLANVNPIYDKNVMYVARLDIVMKNSNVLKPG
ncbi:hypothetical protein [Allofrancisella inopinata]|nr:hypothetical protein [Allofrancisella inopinata]